MTALQSARRGRPDGPPARRVPFPTIDEITRHCLTDDEPETVHIEIHLPGRPDPSRLSSAVREALLSHPRTLIRQTPARWWRRHYEWELTGMPDTDPVSYPDDNLDGARRRALGDCPRLDASPQIRIEVIEHNSTWVLVVAVNHTALDAGACLRVLATVAECYGGADNSPAPAPVRARGAACDEQPRELVPLPWRRTARIASDTLYPGTAGNGIMVADLPLPSRPRREPSKPAAYTVNDQLLVATWIMVTRWNRLHGLPARPVRMTMPVDGRPRTAEMPIGNGTRLAEVTFGPEERETYDALTAGALNWPDVARLLHATAARTRALKAANRPPLGLAGELLTAPVLPIGLRAATVRALRTAAAPWAPTTLLSNIGRIPYLLDFGDAGRAQAVWFSAPAHSPRGLSVTTASTGGRLQVALRWSHARLDDAAGNRLGALFADSLASTSCEPAEESP